MRNIFSTILLFFFILPCAQAQVHLLKRMSDAKYDRTTDVTLAYDSTILLTGTGDDLVNSAQSGSWLQHFSRSGTTLWNRFFTDTVHPVSLHTVCANNQRIIVGGTAAGFVGSSTQGFYAALDTSGNLLWTKWMGDTTVSTNDAICSVDQNGSGYVMLAVWRSSSSSSYYPMLMSVTATGGVIWAQALMEPIGSGEYAVVKQSGSSFFLLFQNNSNSFLVKTSSNGYPVWTRKYPPYYTAMNVTQQGDVLLAGKENSNCNGIIMAKVSGSGTMLWSNNYCTSTSTAGSFCTTLKELSDHSILLTTSGGGGFNYKDGCVLRFDNSGHWLAAHEHGNNNAEEPGFRGIVEYRPGAIAVGGHTDVAAQGNLDIQLMYTDTTLHPGCNYNPISFTESPYPVVDTTLTTITLSVVLPVQTVTSTIVTVPVNEQDCMTSIHASPSSQTAIEVFPNPGNGDFIFRGNMSGTVTLHISDALGRQIYSENIRAYDKETRVHLDVDDGIYFYSLRTTTGQTAAGKLIIQH